jgi:uncharacterized protein YdeI (YjbR/CyaY-like superfamily)
MQLGETLYVTNRKQWRAWLAKHHKTKKEIWLVYYRKDSGKRRIPYNDAVEEALCYGWIDSTNKGIDAERLAQRFSPRRKNSPVSPMNKERIRRLIAAKKMTKAGMESIGHELTEDLRKSSAAKQLKAFHPPEDILDALKADPLVWKNYEEFPASYRRIRVGWIEGARNRPAEFQKRLRYFIKMTGKGKRFGMVQ